MSYNFSHWKSLPKVSFQCLTYGRPRVLEEAIQSFLLQDYVGEKEMVIVNDLPGSPLVWPDPDPRITIINLSERIPTIGEKRNFCCEHCTGDIICPQDDDDISLPWRISVTVANMTNFHHFKPSHYIKIQGYQISGIQSTNVGHNMCGFSKELWKKVGGYDKMQSGQDQTIEKKFERFGVRYTKTIPKQELFYIYRWGSENYHLSSYGWNKGYNQCGDYVRRKNKPGLNYVYPRWNQDYVSMYKNFIKE